MKRNFKRILSLVIVLAMVVSTMAISVVSTSAASKTKYEIQVSTAGGDAMSIDIMDVTIIGSKGETSVHKIWGLASIDVSFEDAVDVGDIIGIKIKNNGIDDWYPTCFSVSSPSNLEIIYGGRWISDNETVTFKRTDNVFKLDIQTGNVSGAGTDDAMTIKLIDTKGVTSTLLDAADIHPETNAFEKGDKVSLYIYAPDNFGILKTIDIKLTPAGILTPKGDWYVDNIHVTQLSGANAGYEGDFLTKTWIQG